MGRNRALRPIILTISLTLLSALAAAERATDRVQIGRPIVVQAGEKAGDVVCVACSIRVRGQAAGDVVAVAGSIALESGAQVGGDSVAVGGSIRLEGDARVAGDAVAVAGWVHRDPEAVIRGDVTSVGGPGWMLPLLLAPFLLMGAIVALIIWLVQRKRQPVPGMAYPAGTPMTRS